MFVLLFRRRWSSSPPRAKETAPLGGSHSSRFRWTTTNSLWPSHRHLLTALDFRPFCKKTSEDPPGSLVSPGEAGSRADPGSREEESQATRACMVGEASLRPSSPGSSRSCAGRAALSSADASRPGGPGLRPSPQGLCDASRSRVQRPLRGGRSFRYRITYPGPRRSLGQAGDRRAYCNCCRVPTVWPGSATSPMASRWFAGTCRVPAL
jgi:hypothetical protein